MSTTRKGDVGGQDSASRVAEPQNAPSPSPGTRVANQRAAQRLHDAAVAPKSDAAILMAALTPTERADRKRIPVSQESNIDFAYVGLLMRVGNDPGRWKSLSAAVRTAMLKYASTGGVLGAMLSALATPAERRPYLVSIWRTASQQTDALVMPPSCNAALPGIRVQLGELGGAAAQAYFDAVHSQSNARPAATSAAEPAPLPADVTDPAELKRRFAATHDLLMMRTLLHRRFHAQFDAGITELSLRELWKTLERLPANQLAGLREVAGEDTSGAEYDGGGKIKAHNLATANALTKSRAMGSKGEAASWFDDAVRHEVGHAVDDHLGIMRKHGSSPAFGGWQEHPDPKALAHQLVNTSGGRISQLKDPKAREKVIADLAAFMTTKKAPGWVADKQLEIGAAYDAGAPSLLLGDEAFTVAEHGTHIGDGPYTNLPQLHGRCYFSVSDTWVSYSAEALSRKVSDYQFYSRGEWFAEAYKHFYEPGHGDDPTKRNGLVAHDRALAEFFVREVHNAKPGPANA